MGGGGAGSAAGGGLPGGGGGVRDCRYGANLGSVSNTSRSCCRSSVYSSRFAAIIVPRIPSSVFPDIATDSKRALSRWNASENDLKIRATSRVPPEISLSWLFGSSIVRREPLLAL